MVRIKFQSNWLYIGSYYFIADVASLHMRPQMLGNVDSPPFNYWLRGGEVNVKLA